MTGPAFNHVVRDGRASGLVPLFEAVRGLRLRHLGAALAICALSALLGAYYLAIAYSHGQALLLKVPGLLLHGAIFVIAVVSADAYVRHGARPLVAYSSAILVSAIVSPVLRWHLTRALGGENFFGASVAPAVQRTEMLFSIILGMVQSGFGIAAYLAWRESGATARRLHADELRRARIERQWRRAELGALQARVEPDLLFAALARVGDLADTASPRADRLLGDVIELLRLLMPGDDVAGGRVASVEHGLALAVAYLRVHDECAGATRELTVSIGAEVAAAALPPMLVLPVVQAIARQGDAKAIRIEAALSGGALRLDFGPGAGSTEPLFDAAAHADLSQRLAKSLGGVEAGAIDVNRPGILTIRLPLSYELDPSDRAHR